MTLIEISIGGALVIIILGYLFLHQVRKAVALQDEKDESED